MSGRQRDVARAVAARERGRSRLRSVTATIGLASLAAGGALAYELPRATHTKTTSSSAAAASGGSASTGSTSTSGTSSASTGLSSAGAPASSSGTSQVTSGGS
jgi:hypothetical protein